jgi:hypothetical protein
VRCAVRGNLKARIFLALAFLLPGAPAWAGEVYSFTLERHEGLDDQVRTGRVPVDGERFRLELDPEAAPRPFDVLISTGTGTGEIGLDLAGRTHYKLNAPDLSLPTTRALWFFGPPKGRAVSKVKTETREAPETETLAGLSARRYETRASYDLKVRYFAETLRGHVMIEEVSWMAEDRTLPLPSVLRTDVHTALPEVDIPLTQARSRLRGFPVKSQVKIDIDMGKGSERQTYSYTLTVHDLKPAETPDSLFQAPSGFRYEEPVITGPGLAPPGGG